MPLRRLKILSRVEELDAYSHDACVQFPKYEKHVLAAEIRVTLADIIKLIVRAGKKYYKKNTLQDLDIEVEYLRSLIRKSYRLKYINTHRYRVWTSHVDEVGRMVGGWLKTI
jgi:hypothetical protein